MTPSSIVFRVYKTKACLLNSWARDGLATIHGAFCLTNDRNSRGRYSSEVRCNFMMKASHTLMYSFSLASTSTKSWRVSPCFWISQVLSATYGLISEPGSRSTLLNGSKSGCLVWGTSALFLFALGAVICREH